MPSETLLTDKSESSSAAAAGTAASTAKTGNDSSAAGSKPADGAAAPGATPSTASGSAAPAAAGEAKPDGAKAPEKPAVPEKYELKLPDEAVIDAKAFESISALAKELGLSNEQAQRIVAHNDAIARSVLEARVAAHEEQIVKWMDDVKADKEIGGANFDKSVEDAKRLVNKFGDDDLKQALVSSGYGNFPPLVRMLAKIGSRMSEDAYRSGAPAQTQKREVSLAEAFYGQKG